MGGYVCWDGREEGCATERPHKYLVMRELKRMLWFRGGSSSVIEGKGQEDRIGRGRCVLT
jgi:hypothetical protein